MAKGALKGKTVFDLASEIRRTDSKGNVTKVSPPVTEGIKPKKFPLKEGYQVLKPEEVSSMLVPTQELVDGKIHGFQRPVKNYHARRIAEAIMEGKPLPAIEAALYRNAVWVVDGQNRAIGSIIAGREVPVLIRHLNADEMRNLFVDQSKGKAVNPSIIVLSASNDFAEYVQDAVTDSSNHPWGNMVTHRISSEKHITPFQMYSSVLGYVTSTLGRHVTELADSAEFNKTYADELAVLFKAFGTKTSNPIAFRPVGIKAMSYSAVTIIRRQGSRKADVDRWVDWMPRFPWEEYMGIRKSKELAVMMIRHWNKRLHDSNKIKLPDEIL